MKLIEEEQVIKEQKLQIHGGSEGMKERSYGGSFATNRGEESSN
jgi:hypothetical protein